MKLSEIIKSLGSKEKVDIDFEVQGITGNSKQVQKDFVFVAVKGSRQDGSSFIDDALNRGAGAVIIDDTLCPAVPARKVPFVKVKDARRVLGQLAAEFYGNPSSRVKVVGVTGTNGKTTITYLLESLIRESGGNPGVIGTINYRYNGQTFPAPNTTPGPVELQSLLSVMAASGVDHAALEVSSHALDQSRTAGIQFHSAIFTNLTQDHLDYHGTLDNYFAAKCLLFKGLGKRAFCVINTDDDYGRKIPDCTQAGVVTYGIDRPADVMARKIDMTVERTSFVLTQPGATISIRTPLIGRHNVLNVLALCGWAYKAAIPLAVVKSVLEKFSAVPGRLERIETGKGFSVFVDYAHTEDALKNVIETLRALPHRRIIVVFGCGGDRDKTKRPKMGRVVSELADQAIITNDNPRSEDPLDIIAQIKQGITKDNYSVQPDRAAAIRAALEHAEHEDVIIVAGKGHEDYQIEKGIVTHFDDREAVRACLQSMS